MKWKACVTFHSSFPDDSEWDESGMNIVTAGGHSIAAAITAALDVAGCECDQIGPVDYYGWVFDISYGRAVVYCVIQSLAQEENKWLLLLESKRFLADFFLMRDNQADVKRIQQSFEMVLAQDSRIFDVVWKIGVWDFV